MSKVQIEVEITAAGQPRPYADSRYEATIRLLATDYRTKELGPVKWNREIQEDKVKQLARALVCKYSEKPEWHEARLSSLKMVSQGLWKVVIVQPYLD